MTPTRFISRIGSLVVVCAMTAAIAAAPAPAHGQAAFNGTWSVLIITDRGPCDRAYRYPLQVKNGRVTYGGQADFKVDGRVKANGSGRLVAGSGSGTWQGAGSSSNCSGTWTAEKRG
jgi:hypothetical protein